MDAAWSIDNFHASTLAGHLYLVTYRLSQSGRVSRRATVWRRHDSGWKAVNHQETLSRDWTGVGEAIGTVLVGVEAAIAPRVHGGSA